MNALFAPGAKRTRFMVAFGLTLLLATPAVMIWAGKAQITDTPENESQLDQSLARDEARRMSSVSLPEGYLPPAEFSPFGGVFKPRHVTGSEAAGLMPSPFGDIAWDPAADEVTAGLKPGLRWGANDLTRGEKGAMRPGLNYVRLSAAAQENPDAAMRSIAEAASILSALPRATLLVNVEARNMHLLRQSPYIDKVRAREPGMAISHDFAARPEIRKAAASDPNISAWVTLVPGTSTPDAARKISQIPGVSDVTESAFGGQLLLKVDYKSVDRLARAEGVLEIATHYDYLLNNDENVPTVQAGSAEDSLFIRPFDLVGVDGGGIDTNGDGRRINNGTDLVPPQIVTIIDNGISIDTPNFSQTATQITTLIPNAPIGPAHRKIHSIINAGDTGTGCDGALSGGSTHGNIVAATIAAYPSQLGFCATRSGIGGLTQPRCENLDGVARGARIILEDAATSAVCTVNSWVERGGNVSPGSLIDRMNVAICPVSGGVGACAGITGGGTETHLAVLPFGAPANFSTFQFQASNGTYPQQAVDLDTFLYNNRDFMIFSPVGNNGGLVSNNRLGLALFVVPDLFNGTALDEDPNFPQAVQIPPPATAKNVVTVGSSPSDCFTFFAPSDCESSINVFSSRGPATPQSLRMAPIVLAPSFDLIGTPYTAGVAVFRSNDNDNLAPIDAQLDEGNFGTSFSAGYMTGAGAIIRDYFAQGFYPTGDRVTADRTPNLSGAFVKAALASSSDFAEGRATTQGWDNNERNIRRTRALDMGTVSGEDIGILGNSEQGYGRPILTHVLPLSDWSDSFVVHPASGQQREYPAAGMLAFDRLATGEPLINNTTQTSVTHTFRVASAFTINQVSGAVAVTTAQLRIALAWPDLPSPANAGGVLINDLDLLVESPGPDNCLTAADTKPNGAACPAGAATDNEFISGNDYDGGRNNGTLDQWSRTRTAGTGVEIHDYRNPIEAIHLNGDPNNDRNFADSHLYLGRWRVTVRRGWGPGGSPEDPITIIPSPGDPDGNEDDNSNGRLDAGEDNNANGLLDQPGQPYSLVVSGPVFLAEANPPAGPVGYPASQASWTSVRLTCASNATLNILDTTGTATPNDIKVNTTYQVLNAAGAVVDTETNFNYTAGASPFQFVSAPVPVRIAGPAVAGNGILEADTDYQIVATYARAGQRAVSARALVDCTPDLVNGAFTTAGGNAVGEQVLVSNGCDNDENLDAGEVVTYGVALLNRSRTDSYADLNATLTPSGPGAGAVRVLDSPKNAGTMPGGAFNGVFFHVFVDPTAANALAVNNRVVTFTLTLDSLFKGERISRQSYSFTHAINSDRESLFYSTDYPNGGREVRDINRNLEIDPPDSVDPFLGFIVPREDVTFSTLFSGSGAPATHFTNELGEDLDLSGGPHNGAERDIIPDGIVNRGILNSNVVADPAHRVPWHYEVNNGGWIPFRHPGSTPAGISSNPVWEYKTTGGQCGFQTSTGSTFGIWHTGDGDPSTPALASAVCDNHAQPNDQATPVKVELIFDVLESPIIAKVNQNNDARGFPYVVEFQRFAQNENVQTFDGYAGGGVNIDNNVDSDNANSLLGQQMDSYYTRRSGGWPYVVFRLGNNYFNEDGIDPETTSVANQRTFGPFVDAGVGGVIDPGDTGFSGYTIDNNPASASPIPTAATDFLPYQVPGAPAIGVCDGGTNDNTTCDPANGADPCITGGGVCTTAINTVAGPVRNFEGVLVGYEGGYSTPIGGTSQTEFFFFFNPGRAGNRWQIGVGFWALESPSGETDYGMGIDDTVFEWVEYHPVDEAALGHAPACTRFNGIGLPEGGQCATLTADRTNLYECDEAIEITLFDNKCNAGTAAGSVCATDANCPGAANACVTDNPTVTVQITTESDANVVDYAGQQVLYPNAKTYTLTAVPGTPGLFRGSVIFSTTTNNATHAFTVPGSDSTFTVYYYDPVCDADRDGQDNEDDFANVDGDGIADNVDNCPQIYNPGQENGDGDAFGALCDNCPSNTNDQADANADGVGDLCEFDDADGTALFAGDGTPDNEDNCPDIRNPEQTDSDVPADGRGDLCDTHKAAFGNANGRIGHSFAYFGACGATTAGICDYPTAAAGAACTNDEDCNRACNTNTGLCEVSGVCSTGDCSVSGEPCDVDGDCPEVGETCLPPAACTWFGDCTLSNCVFDYTAPIESVGTACTTNAQCYVNRDRDGDTVADQIDNCVLTPNAAQTNSDNDTRGNACDPDCLGRTTIQRCTSNASTSADCVTNGAQYTVNRTWTIANNGNCSNVDDDTDVDFVEDVVDNCPTIQNLPIIAGTQRQRDSDRDGAGDICDPAGTLDDENDGIPDDVVTFSGTNTCRSQPLANLTILSASYQDTNGDIDAFPDTGETGRIRLVLTNNGVALTDATIVLSTADPDVACITKPSVLAGSIAAGQTVTVGDFIPNTPGLEFVASNAMNYTGPPAVAPRVTLCVTVVANETLGTQAPTCFNLLADLNAPPGVTQEFTNGPDGLAGTADDGTLVENFDIDRDGDGDYTLQDTWLSATAPGVYRGYCSTAPTTACAVDADCPLDGGGGPGICYRGSYIRGTDSGQPPLGTVNAVSCGGFNEPSTDPQCALDPDFPMDWHFHCPIGAQNCPNLETGPCVGGCSYSTPTGGTKSHSTPNSLHMGAHFVQTDNLQGDTTHFRTVQGFQSAPMNMALFPRPGDLEMSFFHIARIMDNDGVSGGNNVGQCTDCADVQIQLDMDPDPLVDTWGFWDKLVPFENVYDSKSMVWSAFNPKYCVFTPTDTGTEPPNPRGVHETLCFPLGQWSSCGSVSGTVATATVGCVGPGEVDPSGVGVWVRTSFNLAGYLGQRIRIRWIAESWNFGPGTESYYEIGEGWNTTTTDDGWWIDDIRVAGTVTQQVTPEADTVARVGSCPADACNENVADRGTNVVLKVTDLNGNLIDGVNNIQFGGQSIRISAIDSTLPGGCVGGVAEYQFSREGDVVQDFGPKSFYLDAPEGSTSYSVLARCSSDFTCTSLAGATIEAAPYSGDGSDTFFGERSSPESRVRGVLYFRGLCTAGSAGIGAPCNQGTDCGTSGACSVTITTADDVTVLRWWGPGWFIGSDLIRGTVPNGPAPRGMLAAPSWNLAGLEANCFLSNVTGTPSLLPPGTNYTSGNLNQTADPNPAVGAVKYYLVTSNAPGGTNVNAFGCANPGICNNLGWCEGGPGPGNPCNGGDCGVGGTCIIGATHCTKDAGLGRLIGCTKATTCAGGVNIGKLCFAASDCPGSTCPAVGICSSAQTIPPNKPCNGTLECTGAGNVVFGTCSLDATPALGQVCYGLNEEIKLHLTLKESYATPPNPGGIFPQIRPYLPNFSGTCMTKTNKHNFLIRQVGGGLVCP